MRGQTGGGDAYLFRALTNGFCRTKLIPHIPAYPADAPSLARRRARAVPGALYGRNMLQQLSPTTKPF
jgi:hypothetical protein